MAQDLLRSPEWTLGIDDPVFVVQRCQISREGFWIGQRHVLAEELQLSGTMSGSKLFQDKPSISGSLYGQSTGAVSMQLIAIRRIGSCSCRHRLLLGKHA